MRQVDGAKIWPREVDVLLRMPVGRRLDKREGLSEKDIQAVDKKWEVAAERFILNLFRRGAVTLEDVGVSLGDDVVRPPLFSDTPRSHFLRVENRSAKRPAGDHLAAFFLTSDPSGSESVLLFNRG